MSLPPLSLSPSLHYNLSFPVIVIWLPPHLPTSVSYGNFYTYTYMYIPIPLLTCLLGLCSGLTISPGSDTLLVESPRRLKRLFTVGGFSSTASIISGIIGAELERFILSASKLKVFEGRPRQWVLVWAAGQRVQEGCWVLCNSWLGQYAPMHSVVHLHYIETWGR